MGEFVRLDVDGTVATIRLDRPPANAISRQVSDELRDAVLEAGERDDVRAVVVWGGPKIFAAGADIKDMVGWGPEEVRPVVSALGDALVVLEEVPKVTIAAIEGYCLGGGCELALACDFRFAAEGAELGQPEIALGIVPGAGGTQRLPRLVGHARARELVYSGRRVGADEALRIGLVDAVTPPNGAHQVATEVAGRYARGPTRALAAAKEAMNAAALGDIRRGLGVERDVFVGLFATEDQKEGMKAFLEKREPEFKGK
ncbi:MAG: enoyl-CoA hydratase/isomerase family protein [Actinomycetota bacterium]